MKWRVFNSDASRYHDVEAKNAGEAVMAAAKKLAVIDGDLLTVHLVQEVFTYEVTMSPTGVSLKGQVKCD